MSKIFEINKLLDSLDRLSRGEKVHIDNLKGINSHHQAETIFKAFGRALRMAVTPDERQAGVIPSTKGSL